MSENDIRNEFIELGNNLKRVVNSAWESEERKRLQEEIQEGLTELGSALQDIGQEVQDSPVTQKVREGVENISNSVRSGEMQDTVRSGFLSTLQQINSEINEAIQKWDSQGEDSPVDND